MESIDQRVKLHNKPFDEMELEELYAEQACYSWLRRQIIQANQRLKKKKWWLEENKPILTKEEIQTQYENGELSEKQYMTAFARRKKAIDYRMRVLDYMTYAERIILDLESAIAYLNESIAKKEAELAEKRHRSRKKTRGYDPRKRVSKNNQNPLDPRRKWETREDDKPLPKLHRARARWKNYKAQEKPSVNAMKRMQPIITWDVERLMHIAKDRGFYTDIAVTATIAEALKVSINGANAMLQSGKLSWGQCMVIGSLFEMTPKEFCDVFMSGYFVEVADGVFRAQVDDIDNLLDAPYKAKPMIAEGDDEVGV